MEQFRKEIPQVYLNKNDRRNYSEGCLDYCGKLCAPILVKSSMKLHVQFALLLDFVSIMVPIERMCACAATNVQTKFLYKDFCLTCAILFIKYGSWLSERKHIKRAKRI